jgi:hypothetical protein
VPDSSEDSCAAFVVRIGYQLIKQLLTTILCSSFTADHPASVEGEHHTAHIYAANVKKYGI